MENQDYLNEANKKAKKDKKEKKEKKEKAQPEEEVEETEQKEEGVETAKKSEKKRKMNDLQEESGESSSPRVVSDEDEAERKRQKKEKKRLKKEQKRGEAKGEAASGEDEGEESARAAVQSSAETSSSSKRSSESNLYHEHPSTANLSSSQVASYREELQIALEPAEEAAHYKPIQSFDYLRPSIEANCPFVMRYITSKGFAKPSPIQSQCWPILLSGRDAIGIAATGSGKTLAFLIPAMLKISYLPSKPKGGGGKDFSSSTPTPRVLILAPTRELAMQSHQVVEEMAGPKGVCIYGGVPKQQQKQDLRNGADIVVATPGRLMDLIDEKALSLANVVYLVLDEADRMLDEGFEPAIQRILSLCPKAGDSLYNRQTVMFSATWPETIRKLAEKYLRSDVVRITIGSEELSANHRVQQIVECIDPREKDSKLLKLLDKYHASRTNRILIFVLYKKEAADLQGKLERKGYNVTGIHGDKSQYDRTKALEEFKAGKIPLLIATDVAARGLDIPQVEYVINYTFPLTVEEYVHRIGRTGRGGASGISHTFFTDNEKGLAGGLVGVLQEAKQEIPQEIYKYNLVTKKKTSQLYGDFGPRKDLAGAKATKITFD